MQCDRGHDASKIRITSGDHASCEDRKRSELSFHGILRQAEKTIPGKKPFEDGGQRRRCTVGSILQESKQIRDSRQWHAPTRCSFKKMHEKKGVRGDRLRRAAEDELRRLCFRSDGKHRARSVLVFVSSSSMSCKKLQSNQVLMPNGQIQNPIVPTDSSSSGKANRKARLRWTPELHFKFVAAVLELGGATDAKPTAIIQAMERMGVCGLTLNHIKSHLQKYRTAYYQQHKDEGREKADFGQQHEFMKNGTLFPIIFPTHATKGKEICSVESSQTGISRRALKKMQKAG
ncbi:Myb-like DNA-binding domain containing protein [Musa troglodytarum]|uniref:Myb-like DNA-binding domain containing protein n=1 Tax=Musa troglodytarum TaxID=320322 RepID=A0A9E7JXU8_9LILI|nr:Myb-like DNA-binding domain containing protein [Musa troglodytarum]